MIQIYGVPWSRASRCLWVLEEVGAEYSKLPVVDTRAPDYLAINPNGRVPALVDDDVVIWESLAINLYLARRFPSDLSPKSMPEEAHVLKWSFWAESELEYLLRNCAAWGEDRRSPPAPIL
jgi:glutathione S-transferase